MSSALGSVSGFAALAGLGLGGNDYATEEAIAVLKSESLTEAFIQDNNLLPELFPKSWDPAPGVGYRAKRFRRWAQASARSTRFGRYSGTPRPV